MSKRTTSDKSPWIETQQIADIAEKTGNIYKSIAVVAKRSKQIASNLKEELNSKLEEFASSVDNLEEVHENREQIEISKYYEKLPNAVILALNEFEEDETYYRFQTEEETEEQ
ncbi:MAG: DNA-directed RNA polymerase subunit omega [Saprospiraceae bacterium]|nr:DNA-directed RNA polymerase subunit omega [Saprospiraceae bacterium]